MTQLITRYFDSERQARDVYRELVRVQRFSPRIMSLYTDPDGLSATLTKAHVAPETAAAYETRLADGGAVLLVRANNKPLAVAQTTREVTAAMGAADMGGLTEEVTVEDPPRHQLSVLTDHPHILARPLDTEAPSTHMADWPFPLISRRKPFTGSVVEPHGHMASWPIGHLVPHDKRYGRFPFGLLVPGQKYMAKFPFGHIVPGHKYMAKFPFAHIVPGHKHMAKFPFGHLVPGHKFMARFPFGHLVPRGWRFMANWPFPHLINGEQGQNSLVPGHKYMAKFPFGHLVSHDTRYGRFPFGLLVPGQKFMAKFPFGHIVPGHRFMAKFPFAHIVPGHKHMAKFPFGHIVPGHKFMANWIWPHSKNRPGDQLNA